MFAMIFFQSIEGLQGIKKQGSWEPCSPILLMGAFNLFNSPAGPYKGQNQDDKSKGSNHLNINTFPLNN